MDITLHNFWSVSDGRLSGYKDQTISVRGIKDDDVFIDV